MTTTLHSLPRLCLACICSFLDLDDLIGLSAVCLDLNDELNSNVDIWRDRAEEDFSVSPEMMGQIPLDGKPMYMHYFDSFQGKRQKLTEWRPSEGSQFDDNFKVGSLAAAGRLDDMKRWVKKLDSFVKKILETGERPDTMPPEMESFIRQRMYQGRYWEELDPDTIDEVLDLFDPNRAGSKKLSVARVLSEKFSGKGWLYYGNYSTIHDVGIVYRAPGLLAGDQSSDDDGDQDDKKEFVVTDGAFVVMSFSTNSRERFPVPMAHCAPVLCWAAMFGQTEMCKYLIEKVGVDLDGCVDAYGATALDLATFNGFRECAAFLRASAVPRGNLHDLGTCKLEPSEIGRRICQHLDVPNKGDSDDDSE